MASPLNVHVDTSGLIPWSSHLDAATKSAARMSGASAIRAMRAEGSRKIREKYAIRVASIGKALSITYPSSKAVLLWKLKAKSEIMPVIAFGPRQTRRGVRVTISKGKPTAIRDGFVATMRSGHRGVFTARGPKRIIQSGTYKGKYRRPIKEAYTTRVAEAFGNAIPAIAKRGHEVFTSTFNRVLPLEMAKRGGALAQSK